MLGLNNKYESQKLEYKYPKNNLILSDKTFHPKDNINDNIIDNNKHYLINSEKLNNFYKIESINRSVKENSFRQHNDCDNKRYLNSIKSSVKSRNNPIDISDIYTNSDNITNFYSDYNLNSIKKTNNINNNHNVIINNSLNNHIKNFLNKYNIKKNAKNNKEFQKNNCYQIQSPIQKKENLNSYINKRNVYEVKNELEIVNDKKLNKTNFTEREYKK